MIENAAKNSENLVAILNYIVSIKKEILKCI